MPEVYPEYNPCWVMDVGRYAVCTFTREAYRVQILWEEIRGAVLLRRRKL